jgi:biofilm PGA synthesis N-glycosyltransferase PgaC
MEDCKLVPMILILTCILGSYFFFLVVLLFGWWRMRSRQAPTPVAANHKISVVVAMRNESASIQNLLTGLLDQEYANYEIILVDDHSSDNTIELIQLFKKDKSDRAGKISFIRNHGTGKKAALTSGVIAATGEIIATTDADAIVPRHWLSNIDKMFSEEKVKFVMGGVALQQDGTFFSDMQAIEFSSLIGTTASTAAIGIPTMANGANMAYRKSVFEEVGGYHDNMHIPSGDDEFLLRKIAAVHPQSVWFMNVPDAVVRTKTMSTWSQFFNQRVRWAGKWRYNTSLLTMFVAVYVFLVQLAIAIAFLQLSVSGWIPILSLLCVRFVLEAILLYNVSRFSGIRWNWGAFVALQIAYPFYVLMVSIASQFMTYTWKDRRLSQTVS